MTGEDCAKLERLEQFARTMMSSGKIGNFVRTLYSLRSYAKKHAEERAEAEGRDAPGTFSPASRSVGWPLLWMVLGHLMSALHVTSALFNQAS